MRRSHQDIDLRNQLQDRLLARRLRRNSRLVSQARGQSPTLEGRRRRPPAASIRQVAAHFGSSLGQGDCRFLMSDTPMARRLRQSPRSRIGPQFGVCPKARIYVDVVSPEMAALPEGWETRVKRFRVGPITWGRNRAQSARRTGALLRAPSRNCGVVRLVSTLS